MRPRMLLVMTVVALLVAGCTDDGDDPPAATTTSAAVTTVPAVTTTGGAGPSTSTTAPAAVAIVLRPDGLGLVDFGDAKDAVISALTAALGPIDESGTGCELAGTDVTTARWRELRVQFVDGKFESYNVRPPNGVEPVLGLKTEEGVGVGSTVAQLTAAYGLQVTIPGLPAEFGGDNFKIVFGGTGPELYGSVSATGPTGKITAIFTQLCE